MRRLLGILVLGVLAAGCSQASTGTVYGDEHTSIAVPEGWMYYSNDDLAEVVGTPFVAEVEGVEMPIVSRFGFDASPIRTLQNLQLTSQADSPVASSVTRRIPSAMRPFVSRYLLAEIVVPYHNSSAFEELVVQDIDLGADYQGVRVAVAYRDDLTGQDVVVHLISVTNPEVTELYHVAIGCQLDCFEVYGSEISEAIDTWQVAGATEETVWISVVGPIAIALGLAMTLAVIFLVQRRRANREEEPTPSENDGAGSSEPEAPSVSGLELPPMAPD